MSAYSGFSTQETSNKFKLSDFELIKRDLLNHFNIKRGEKLMKPTFGCGIWEYLFEPLTEETRQRVLDEVKGVIDYDPRVNATKVTVSSYDQGIQIELDLSLVRSNQTSSMVLRFEQNQSAVLSY
jgi:phage baseplate assembly protein W